MVESFSRRFLSSKVLDMYVAAAFFASVIFFVLNSYHFTPLEAMIGIVLSTIVFKGIANIMLSMVISLLNLENEQDRLEFEDASNRLESLVNDLAIKEAAVQTSKNNK
ncbi:MAG: hypothetical protein IE909_06720 [Campylobacterales bacterium]|nr:hypothetical protein [Campylobacterales bacterium]